MFGIVTNLCCWFNGWAIIHSTLYLQTYQYVYFDWFCIM